MFLNFMLNHLNDTLTEKKYKKFPLQYQNNHLTKNENKSIKNNNALLSIHQLNPLLSSVTYT